MYNNNNSGWDIFSTLVGLGVAAYCGYKSGQKDLIQSQKETEMERMRREINNLKAQMGNKP